MSWCEGEGQSIERAQGSKDHTPQGGPIAGVFGRSTCSTPASRWACIQVRTHTPPSHDAAHGEGLGAGGCHKVQQDLAGAGDGALVPVQAGGGGDQAVRAQDLDVWGGAEVVRWGG